MNQSRIQCTDRRTLPQRFFGTVVLALGISLVSGCADFSLKKHLPWPFAKNEELPQPVKMEIAWSDATLNRAAGPAVRGFGARFMFYDKDDKKPIQVEGKLVVFAFDEMDRTRPAEVPDRKYVFTSENLTKHYSKSSLGDSYSFWIPWDEVGGQQKTISLIARFTPKSGGVLMSKQTRHLLPGKKPRDQGLGGQGLDARGLGGPVARKSGSSEIQTVGYTALTTHSDQPVQSGGELRRPMTTTTIPIPTSLGRRLRASRHPVESDSPTRYVRQTVHRHGLDTASKSSQRTETSGDFGSLNFLVPGATSAGKDPSESTTFAGREARFGRSKSQIRALRTVLPRAGRASIGQDPASSRPDSRWLP